MRPYAGGAGQRGSSMPSRGGSNRGSELDIFGGGFGGGPGGGLFGGRDPFAEFGSMDPFRGGGFGGGFGGMGGMMQRFDDMSRDMDQMMKGMTQGGGPGGAVRNMPGGNGQYAVQSFAMSSHMGPDGKMHTERFVSSDIGNREKGIREAQQAYSNSSSGKEKMGLERQLGDRARKMVKERDRNTMEERSTEMFRGMDESSASHFDRDFGSMAHHLPNHPRFDGRALQNALQGGGRPALGDYSQPSSGGRSIGGGRQHSTCQEVKDRTGEQRCNNQCSVGCCR